MRFIWTRSAASAIAALLLAACASVRTYHALDGHSGYAETALGGDHWIVAFASDDYTVRETVNTYLLYRAAELTAENGHEWFVMASPPPSDDVQIVVEAERPQADRDQHWRPQWRQRGRFFWSDLDPVGPMPNERRPLEDGTAPRAHYSAHAEIVMGSGPPPAGAFYAQETIARLGPSIVRPRATHQGE